MTLTATEFFSSQPDEQEERIFWKSIRLPNRTYKTTDTHRLDDVNAAVIRYFVSAGTNPRSFLDVGASSGVSTLEWRNALQASGIEPNVTATDLSLNARIIQLLPFYNVLVIGAPIMEPLQHAIFGWALPAHFHFGVRSVLGGFLSVLLFKPLRALGISMGVDRHVELVSPRVTSQSHITFIEDDILNCETKSALGTFDVVRAANILNLDYFSEHELRTAVANIKRLLGIPGSFLIAVRTEADGTNNGTMFRLNNSNQLEPILTVGRGSEIANLVVST